MNRPLEDIQVSRQKFLISRATATITSIAAAQNFFVTTAFNVSDPFIAEVDSLVDKIDKISDSPDCYEDDEIPPDQNTKNSAKQLVYHVIPRQLLTGADVYPYFGEVNIVWENNGKKVKLIVPPQVNGRRTAIYRGQLRDGRVGQPFFEDASGENLRESLHWLYE